MRSPQIINRVIDTLIAINGDSVIDDTSQVKLTAATIQVNLTLLDLTSGVENSVTDITMTRYATTDFYTLTVSDVNPILTDRRSYVGIIVENGVTNNMRDFKLDGFAVDDETFEDVWMRLPYRINIGGGTSYIEWHDDTTYSNMRFRAKAFEGGVGTTYATLPERVTHRGPVEVYP